MLKAQEPTCKSLLRQLLSWHHQSQHNASSRALPAGTGKAAAVDVNTLTHAETRQCHLSLPAGDLSFPYRSNQERYLRVKQEKAIGICRLDCTSCIGLHITAGVNSHFV